MLLALLKHNQREGGILCALDVGEVESPCLSVLLLNIYKLISYGMTMLGGATT